MKIFELFFWLSIFLFFHTYLFYPLLLWWLAKDLKNNTQVFSKGEPGLLPRVSVIMSVYNEEKVIGQKIRSLLQQDFPMEKLQVFIGSDASADQTNAIVEAFAKDHFAIQFFPFSQRRGKPTVINDLVDSALQHWPAAPDHVLLITDANVILEEQTIWNLVRHYRNPKIVIVDAHMVPTGVKEEGISKAESTYISSEVMLKHREGKLWGKMIGPFGGCYSIRSSDFSRVPSNFLVDDFYITMKVFEREGDAINDLDARCFEAVSHDIREEYRRKSRISAGNFQNLLMFRHLWWPPVRPLAFAFFSHKVLRWLGPFLLLMLLLCLGVLACTGNIFYQILFFFSIFVLLILPAIDLLLIRWKIDFLPLRGIRYFLFMNMALLEGFFKFVKGIKSNVWQPPKRN